MTRWIGEFGLSFISKANTLALSVKLLEKTEWIPRKEGTVKRFILYLEGGKMPFNEKLVDQERKCFDAGQKMVDNEISIQEAIRMAQFPYNSNKNKSFNKKSAKWDNQRIACANGVRKAFGREDLVKPYTFRIKRG